MPPVRPSNLLWVSTRQLKIGGQNDHIRTGGLALPFPRPACCCWAPPTVEPPNASWGEGSTSNSPRTYIRSKQKASVEGLGWNAKLMNRHTFKKGVAFFGSAISAGAESTTLRTKFTSVKQRGREGFLIVFFTHPLKKFLRLKATCVDISPP